ncbi:unnamed protein product, partial [Phaeothamnion confervicola]
MHRIEPCCTATQTWFGYETWAPAAKWSSAWLNILDRFGDHPAVFAVDLFNEPHGIANWGLGGPDDWATAATGMIETILRQRPQFKGLFFVEGVDVHVPAASPKRSSEPYFWAENLAGVFTDPIQAGGNRLVYSPHVYGPTVFAQPYFAASDGFPNNMPAIWDAHFGWVEATTGKAVVIGEWGGKNVGDDATWHD